MNSYPKRGRNANDRASKPRKRQFCGNRYKKDISNENKKSANDSALARKLSSAGFEYVYNPSDFYRIIKFFSVFGALIEILICKTCKKNIRFEEAGVRGFGFKLCVICSCGRRKINSGPLISTGFEINRRIVLVMRLLGVGREGINIFAELMDCGLGLSKDAYSLIIRHIHDSVKPVFKSVCLKAVSE